MTASKIALITGLAFEKKIADDIIEQEKVEGLVARNAGMGGPLAGKAVDEALKAGAMAMVSYGVCGALAPEFVAGDIIIPQKIISPDGRWNVDQAWRERLAARLSKQYEPHDDTLFTSRTPVSSVTQKARLRTQTGAGAVDMESAILAKLAAEAGLPFIAVRVVHDVATQAIPPAFANVVDANGEINGWKLIKGLIFNWPGLAVLKALSDADTQARTNLDDLTRLALPDFGFVD